MILSATFALRVTFTPTPRTLQAQQSTFVRTNRRGRQWKPAQGSLLVELVQLLRQNTHKKNSRILCVSLKGRMCR